MQTQSRRAPISNRAPTIATMTIRNVLERFASAATNTLLKEGAAVSIVVVLGLVEY